MARSQSPWQISYDSEGDALMSDDIQPPPSLQSIIDWTRMIAKGAEDLGQNCQRRAEEHAYKLVMETGPGWGTNQDEKARTHLRECARDGGRANVYGHNVGTLNEILRQLETLKQHQIELDVADQLPSAENAARTMPF